ncbi:hypothetical protein D7X94_09110 [Acutalibacter sp. 1XD8-33]|uniref:hypothetical protein n=1 Tax=Acutalibacter sp. 1XD8-33 TaxID=2320081 RepID=UPI000EA24CB7|nr:hypothetical protein [Acutalibacter sp. 1XD8-33]RKJ40281.1 hypothetical protein D7X94_09110 [Acutalibacter sp. 1XD8-33]
MQKWSYLAAAVAWILSMIYEWMWNGGKIVQYLAWGAIGVTVLVGLMVRSATKGGSGRQVKAMEWFLLAALMVALFYSMVEHTAKQHLTHVPVLPLYLILFLDFFLSGCYTWWKKQKRP